jgi:hypothetical protein
MKNFMGRRGTQISGGGGEETMLLKSDINYKNYLLMLQLNILIYVIESPSLQTKNLINYQNERTTPSGQPSIY